MRYLANRAALCLALPALGLAALRQLPRYQGILMSVALRLARLDQVGKLGLLDERLIRLFAADDRASMAVATHDGCDDGCNWLNAVYAKAGSNLQIWVRAAPGGPSQWSLSVNGAEDAKLRRIWRDHFTNPTY